MTFITVCCPHCQSEQIVKRGKTRRGTQRYLCQNTACTTGSFLLDYHNRGCLPEVKQTIIDMSLNASGIRDTARVLRISTDTVLSELKKKEALLGVPGVISGKFSVRETATKSLLGARRDYI
jgi:transposase-like protein